MTETTAPSAVEPRRGSAGEVFLVALRLGLTSFGGPIAHLGYYERTYVRQPRLAPDEYAGLVALCQMVPGPASSQVGFLVGLRRAGWGGAFAAWAGFTLPSAFVMFAFALLAPHLEGPTTNAVLHGLKLVAVAVVAQAVWSMARNLCRDRPRAALALIAAALLLVVSGSLVQIAALLIGAVGGGFLCTPHQIKGMRQIYAVRRLLEPELAAGAVPHLTDADFEALEHSIETCAPTPASKAQAVHQRREDLHFHDILAAANPNGVLRFVCEVINHLLRHLVTVGDQPAHPAYQQLGDTNVAAHRKLLAAARLGDAAKVHKLMLDHIDEAGGFTGKLDAAVRRHFVLDSELQARISPQQQSSKPGKTR